MMKYNILLGIFCCVSLGYFSSCSPEQDTLTDISNLDVKQIKRVELKPSNTQLVADGHAVIRFQPLVYVEQNGKESLLPINRVKKEWFEFSSPNGINVTDSFTTANQQLVGQTLSVTASVKGTNVKSNAAAFKVVAVSPATPFQEVTYPVIFHIVRKKNEQTVTGIKYEKEIFEKVIVRLNNAFAGVSSKNAVGTDTRIRFKPALYNLSGTKLEEAGINRVALDDIESYSAIVAENNLLWPPTKYLNIWLLSDLDGMGKYELQDLTENSIPKYMYAAATNVPEGLNLTPYAEDMSFEMNESGVIYRLQDLNSGGRSYAVSMGYEPGTNELIHFVGKYFGLLPNNLFMDEAPAEDYCDDTMGYYISDSFYQKNEGLYKETETCFFLSDNIMDDPSGVHASISQQQSNRMRWVINNCPERSAWKSSFAFTGKE